MARRRGVLTFDATDLQMNAPPSYSLQECKIQLMSEFRIIHSSNIKSVVMFYDGHYAKAHECLRTIMSEINKMQENRNNRAYTNGIRVVFKEECGIVESFQVWVMRRRRNCCTNETCSDELKQEVARVKEELRKKDEEAGRRFALDLLYKDYKRKGQLIECACCFGNSVFDDMVQCTDGHLVCLECMKGYINEIAFGNLKADLGCLMSDCTAQYSHNELQRCLDSVTLRRLDERAFEENLISAKFKNLVRCPYCNFAYILDPCSTKFICQRDGCKKATCRHCGVDWEEHLGLTCSFVARSRNETALRKEYEEKMTKAAVRTCPSCNAQFTKDFGCNHMVCRCGCDMCYLCCEAHIDHTHFCQHGLINRANKKCLICGRCPQHTDWRADDAAAIRSLQKEARVKRKALGFNDDKEIGVPPPPRKKLRFSNVR